MNNLEKQTLRILLAIFGLSQDDVDESGNIPARAAPEGSRNMKIYVEPDFSFSRPDFIISGPYLKLAVFVQGSFWHDSARTGLKMTHAGLKALCSATTVLDEQKAVFWLDKAAENRNRDRKINKTLRALGYTVVRLQEPRIQKNGLAYVSKSIALGLAKSRK